jgi:hypothetical protein
VKTGLCADDIGSFRNTLFFVHLDLSLLDIDYLRTANGSQSLAD